MFGIHQQFFKHGARFASYQGGSVKAYTLQFELRTKIFNKNTEQGIPDCGVHIRDKKDPHINGKNRFFSYITDIISSFVSNLASNKGLESQPRILRPVHFVHVEFCRPGGYGQRVFCNGTEQASRQPGL
jgi:hypothetical protein